MDNVIAIGLTPSRTGIVIGPSRTGIVIGPLLNAQLRHMSVRAAWRHKLSLFWDDFYALCYFLLEQYI